MKTYQAKYERGQDVYFLLKNKVLKSPIHKVKIVDGNTYFDVNENQHTTLQKQGRIWLSELIKL